MPFPSSRQLIQFTLGFGRAANSRDAEIRFVAAREEEHFLSVHFKLWSKCESWSSPDIEYLRAHFHGQFGDPASDGGARRSSLDRYDVGSGAWDHRIT